MNSSAIANYTFSTNLPEMVLSKDVKTYTTEVNSSARRTWEAGMLEAELKEKYLKLHGFDWVSENGDLRLELNIGSMKILSEKREKSLKSAKKGDVKGNRHINFEAGDEIKAKLGVEAPYRALERLVYSKGTGLYLAFPEGQSSIDEGAFDKEYWRSKKGAPDYLALKSEEELAEQAAAYFSDCPALSEKIAAGQYSLNKAALSELIQSYAECN